MNLRQQLKDNLLSHLSDYDTNCNVEIAYVICKQFTLDFISFLRENCTNYDFAENEWQLDEEYEKHIMYTDEEILNIYLNEKSEIEEYCKKNGIEITHHKFSLFQTEEIYYDFSYVGDSSSEFAKECFNLIETYNSLEEAKTAQQELKYKTIIIPSY